VSILEALPDLGESDGLQSSGSPHLTLLGQQRRSILLDPDQDQPRPSRSYESALTTIFANLLQPMGIGVDTAGSTEPTARFGDLDPEEHCEAGYLVAAALLGARRTVQADSLLRELETTTARSSHQRWWRARLEFLWALHSDQTGDIQGLLDHTEAATKLIAAKPEPPSDTNRGQGFGLLHSVDAFARKQLPVLAARARIELGELRLAQTILEDRYGSIDEAEASQPATLAMLARGQGRLSHAVRLAAGALDRADQGAGTELVRLEARIVLADVFFERNDLGAAREQLEAAIETCPTTDATPSMWVVQANLARLAVAQQRATEAVPMLQHLRHVKACGLLSQAMVRDVNQVDIDCRLQLGDLQGAVLVVEDSAAQHFHCETLARLQLCLGRPDRVIPKLRAGRAPTHGAHIRRLILSACAESQQGHTDSAIEAIRTAVEVAQPELYIRPFLEYGTQILPLLCGLGSSASNRYLCSLVSDIEGTSSPATSSRVATVLEPLSEKERQVLQHLQSHRTQRQIASLMFVSINTVKTHVKAIYRKTGAISRDDAITIAHKHGLI
jgi:DNA-binding CsgD family transcriptional regulator